MDSTRLGGGVSMGTDSKRLRNGVPEYVKHNAKRWSTKVRIIQS